MAMEEQVDWFLHLEVCSVAEQGREAVPLLVMEQVRRVVFLDHRVVASARYNGDPVGGSLHACPSHAYRGVGTVWTLCPP